MGHFTGASPFTLIPALIMPFLVLPPPACVVPPAAPPPAVSATGLTTSEAQRRLRETGPNVLVTIARDSLLMQAGRWLVASRRQLLVEAA